jgi:hypothetical protein
MYLSDLKPGDLIEFTTTSNKGRCAVVTHIQRGFPIIVPVWCSNLDARDESDTNGRPCRLTHTNFIVHPAGYRKPQPVKSIPLCEVVVKGPLTEREMEKCWDIFVDGDCDMCWNQAGCCDDDWNFGKVPSMGDCIGHTQLDSTHTLSEFLIEFG